MTEIPAKLNTRETACLKANVEAELKKAKAAKALTEDEEREALKRNQVNEEKSTPKA